MKKSLEDQIRESTKRIETLRKKRGWDASDLTGAAGLGVGTIIRIVAGRVSPSLKNVLGVARALGVSGATLLAECPDWTEVPEEE